MASYYAKGGCFANLNFNFGRISTMIRAVGLKDYKKKRDFRKTPEPAGKEQPSAGRQLRFVIQKHKARRLHYDLRLEMEEVLRSWAVPKGPSLDPGDKRLAVQVEDHPIEYGDFEGVIPEGQYGAGQVIIWDQGTYEYAGTEENEVEAWKEGKLEFRLHGKKLKGIWLLIKTKGRGANDWLFFKKTDKYADPDSSITDEAPESVISGKRVEQLEQASSAAWNTRVRRLLEELEVPRQEVKGRVTPMLATLVDAVPEDDNWVYEMKYDGIRALAVKKKATLSFTPET